jgi:DNA invertase Pin-like site-specific DNA recombinase
MGTELPNSRKSEQMSLKRIKLIAYIRVSTAKQGRSGLGLEAQQEAIRLYASNNNGDVIREYKEVESGARSDRPELRMALDHAKAIKGRMVVAKLDRLTREVRLFLEIVESGADFALCDLPDVPVGPMGRFMLTQFAAFAELERGLISTRTKDAMAAYKARGGIAGAARPECRHNLDKKPGARARGGANAAASHRRRADEAYGYLAPIIKGWHAEGVSSRTIAARLNKDEYTTREGKPWNHVQVLRILDRFKVG